MTPTLANALHAKLANNFANSWERLNAIIEDMRDVEPTDEFNAAALQGLLRELSAETIIALCTIADIQKHGRVEGYPIADEVETSE